MPSGSLQRSAHDQPSSPGSVAIVDGAQLPQAHDAPVEDASSAHSSGAAASSVTSGGPDPAGLVTRAAASGMSPLGVIVVALGALLVGITIGATVSGPDPEAPVPSQHGVELPRPTLGDPAAPVVIEVFSDFGCPYCQRHDRDVEPVLVERYVDSGQVRLTWYDVPFQGQTSLELAVAARAAQRQGRFWEFKEAVFATDGRDASPETLRALAAAAELDLASFERDLEDPALELAVRRDLDTAQRLGVRGTPAFLVAGEPLIGAQPLEAFERLIEEALDR